MGGEIINALTFDVEDWYQGIEIGMERWSEFEKRLHIGVNRILSMLESANTKATFFILGRCAEEHPDLIRAVAAGGHEIATHGYSHSKIYDLTPETFDAELARSIERLASVTGKKILGHRAPYFSITERSLWGLDVLRKNNIRYDCSIYPGVNYRYGIADAPEQPYMIEKHGMPEFPVSVMHVAGKKVGLGGAYFRILPYFMTKNGIRAINASGRPAIFYLHPWEFDPSHPRVEFPRKAQITHYFNLTQTERKFRKLLRDFRFSSVEEVLRNLQLLKG
jgi:polysaccharide deacetylase family protein (PEP-CTERM system associated)